MRTSRVLIPVLTVLALAGCDLEKDPGGPEADELVGQWVGTITRTDAGSEAEGEVIFDLRQDGVWTAAVSDSAAFAPFVDGIWGTTGLNWVGTGRTTDGVQVNFSAPRTETRLEGAWSAGRDINGEFDVRKQ